MSQQLSYCEFLAYPSRLKRADERTRTPSLLITSELFYRTTWTSEFPRISCQSYLLGTTLAQ